MSNVVMLPLDVIAPKRRIDDVLGLLNVPALRCRHLGDIHGGPIPDLVVLRVAEVW